MYLQDAPACRASLICMDSIIPQKYRKTHSQSTFLRNAMQQGDDKGDNTAS